jgi:hypothetical protein
LVSSVLGHSIVPGLHWSSIFVDCSSVAITLPLSKHWIGLQKSSDVLLYVLHCVCYLTTFSISLNFSYNTGVTIPLTVAANIRMRTNNWSTDLMFAIMYLVSLVNTALNFQLWAYCISIFKDWKKFENYLTIIP